MVEVYAQGNLLVFFLVRHAPKNSIFEFFKINAVGYHHCILLVKLFSKMVSKKKISKFYRVQKIRKCPHFHALDSCIHCIN